MTSISEIVNMAATETPADSACTALISIAARAAGYEPIMRKSQLSKICLYHESIKSACTVPVAPKHQVYIIC
ncbi:MAG TPA: hypothetical protein O0X50_00850 [Methanocorpusculum sp.]|nr:hypothetical protein [Methanocorpusculum sp.]